MGCIIRYQINRIDIRNVNNDLDITSVFLGYSALLTIGSFFSFPFFLSYLIIQPFIFIFQKNRKLGLLVVMHYLKLPPYCSH